ncbi:MAG: hypothetical protein DCC59_05430 [Chloroflexi bacterium]|nr:MAG: hypothetical protein DCC59_05430 [Chloroflexota bacterium]
MPKARSDICYRDAGGALRGGSWNNNDNNVRSANRNRNDPTNTNNNVGFRCSLLHPVYLQPEYGMFKDMPCVLWM